MIALRFFIITALLIVSLQARAEGKVYTGLDVYSHTVSRWSKAVTGASFDSDTWIWNLKKDNKHKNKSRDTLLMVPTTAIPDDITLVVWFHGCGGFSQKTFSKRIIPQMSYAISRGSSVAIALPEMPWSTNTSTRCGRQSQVWQRPGELEAHIDDLKEHLETWAVINHGRSLGTVRLVFVGHSAGGSALKSAAKEGGLCRLKPKAVVWSDASYGSWLDRAWHGCLKNASTDLFVLVRKWDKPYKNAERMMRKLRKYEGPARVHYRVLDRRRWTHGRIGCNALIMTRAFEMN